MLDPGTPAHPMSSPADPPPVNLQRAGIVHVTADYPDVVHPQKTQVIKTLVGLVDDRFDQRVLSLNRRHPALRTMLRHATISVRIEDEREPVEAVLYHAPGRGVFHRTMLERLGTWIAHRLAPDPPALIVGHKLTIEGIAVARAAGLLGIPYALSIQGNTDLKILGARPDLARLFARIYHDAAVVFAFAPWAQRAVERRLGIRNGPTITLPCPTMIDEVIAPAVTQGDIVSAFHLDNYRCKNAARLIKAARLAVKRDPDVRLAIIGGGAIAREATVRRLAGPRGHGIRIDGAVAHRDMPGRFHQAAGFALPSLRESYGLVFIEALLAGTPILYPAGAAVDGYFDGQPFAIRVDPRDTAAIAAGLGLLVRDEAALKHALAVWQQSGAAAQFQRPAIARAFGDGLAAALAFA